MSPRGQLERLLVRHGVDSFCVLEEEASVTLRLTVGDRQLQLVVPLPDRWSEEFTRTPTGKVRLLSAQERAYEREVRRRWTALRVLATGKLMADAYGISDLADDYPVAVEVTGRQAHEPTTRRANGKRYVRLSKALLPLVGLAAVIPASSIAAVSLSPGTVERLVTPLASPRPDVLAGNAPTQRVALGIQPVANSSSELVESRVQLIGEVAHSSSRRIAAESPAPRESKSESSSTAVTRVVSDPSSTASVPPTQTEATSDVSATEPAVAPTADPGAGQGPGQGGGPGNGGPGDGGGNPGNSPGDGGGKPVKGPGDGGGKPGTPGDPGKPGSPGDPGGPGGPGDPGGKPGNPDPGGPGSKPGNPTPGAPGSKPGNPSPGNPDPGDPGSKPGNPNPGNPDPGNGGGNPGDPGNGNDPGAGSTPAPGPGSAPVPSPPSPPTSPSPGPKPPKPGH